MKTSINKVDYNDSDCTNLRRIRSYSWLLILGWTALIGASCYWNISENSRVLHAVALAEARTAIDRDLMYRHWVSSQGGIYVQATEKTPPNPYLSHIPERDIVTGSGKTLTLLNSAYMAYKVYELAREQGSFIGREHLTSLKPMRPENVADDWEEKALRSFEKGSTEESRIEDIDGQPYIRLMRPYMAENSCLKCHTVQGYRAGDVGGGLSVSIPIKPLIDATHNKLVGTAAIHGMLWLLGISVIGLGGQQLSRSAIAQYQFESKLRQQTLQMEKEILERQRAQEALQESRAHLQVVADNASNWEYWRLPDNSFIYISPSTENITGYSVADFMGDKDLLTKIIHPDDRELFHHHKHEIDASGQVQPIELRIVRKTGEMRWIGHVCQQVSTPDGLPWGWRASNQDITHIKLIEQELYEQTTHLEEEMAERETAQEELKLLNHSLEELVDAAVADLRRKDQMLIQQSRLAAMGEMINNIAHQWRQPLNNIGLIVQNLQISFSAETITKEELESESGKAMAVIMHMSRTIDDFRNFFREDKEQQNFMVNKVVSHALEFVSAALENRNILVEVVADLEVSTTGYQNEYAQALLNIISNASEACFERHIQEPRILVRITTENGRSVVYIRDNCGGIPEDIMTKIFDPYFTTREPDKGTGIGLYMSKVIIEQNMNGKLTARNLDAGAEFRVEV